MYDKFHLDQYYLPNDCIINVMSLPITFNMKRHIIIVMAIDNNPTIDQITVIKYCILSTAFHLTALSMYVYILLSANYFLAALLVISRQLRSLRQLRGLTTRINQF
jgi:hypothetical protein